MSEAPAPASLGDWERVNQTLTEGAIELVDGALVYNMAGNGRHSEVQLSVGSLLRAAAQRHRCRAVVESAIVVTPGNGRIADAAVYCGDFDPDAFTPGRPCIVVEVVSPSSRGRDFGMKALEYTALGALYLIVDAEHDVITVHRHGVTFPQTFHAGESITLDPCLPGETLDVSAVFA